ncbi:MAG TPA: ester cyclase [Gemmatimonadaceae bacterium]|nr:ester cyclase [Gemmatimonadaceae bacterium]
MTAVILIGACARAGDSAQAVQSGAVLADSAEFIARNLATFDTLDFVVFSHQQWSRLSESHSQDVVVTWPDGHDTHGLTRHVADLKALFVAIPDLAVTEHPIRIANGSWTAVVGRMTGTFSKPMPMAGKTIPPTGRKLDLSMVTIGHWTNSGVMDHEWLFWDNAAYMKQLGLSP